MKRIKGTLSLRNKGPAGYCFRPGDWDALGAAFCALFKDANQAAELLRETIASLPVKGFDAPRWDDLFERYDRLQELFQERGLLELPLEYDDPPSTGSPLAYTHPGGPSSGPTRATGPTWDLGDTGDDKDSRDWELRSRF